MVHLHAARACCHLPARSWTVNLTVRVVCTYMVGNDVCAQLQSCWVCNMLHHLQTGRILNQHTLFRVLILFSADAQCCLTHACACTNASNIVIFQQR